MQTAVAEASMELLEAGLGERLRVVSLGEGKRCRRKLCSLGMHPGCEVELVQCPKGGGECGCCIVACGKDRIAIGKCMADKIRVEKVV
mgnify:CR=1 FL=1